MRKEAGGNRYNRKHKNRQCRGWNEKEKRETTTESATTATTKTATSIKRKAEQKTSVAKSNGANIPHFRTTHVHGQSAAFNKKQEEINTI